MLKAGDGEGISPQALTRKLSLATLKMKKPLAFRKGTLPNPKTGARFFPRPSRWRVITTPAGDSFCSG
jgi:hypothetical protein